MRVAPEITTNGTTVWVNTSACIGRFSWQGVDVHSSAEEQLAGGRQCLDCTHDRTASFDESWERFRSSMLKHHGVDVPDSYKPTNRGFRK